MLLFPDVQAAYFLDNFALHMIREIHFCFYVDFTQRSSLVGVAEKLSMSINSRDSYVIFICSFVKICILTLEFSYF